MHVDHAQPWESEQDPDRIRPYAATTPRSADERADLIVKVAVFEAAAAATRQSEFSRRGFHLRGHELLAAAARPIGLRDHGDNLVRRLRERPQRGNGERRRAEEQDAHGLPLRRRAEACGSS